MIKPISRSLRWRVRFITNFDPMDKHLTVDHPLVNTAIKTTFHSILKKLKSGTIAAAASPLISETSFQESIWAEVLCETHDFSTSSTNPSNRANRSRWIHIDPNYELFNKPKMVETIDFSNKISPNQGNTKIRRNVMYVAAVEHQHDISPVTKDNPLTNYAACSTKVTDVTPRYANQWSRTLKSRGATSKDLTQHGVKWKDQWWVRTLKKVNSYYRHQRMNMGLLNMYHDNISDLKDSKPSSYNIERSSKGGEVIVLQDSSDEEKIHHAEVTLNEIEKNEFSSNQLKEAIPTNKTAFKNHPLYALKSQLKQQEVLSPEAKKHICGMFKGEIIYRRSDVTTALTAKKWLYKHRKVRETELSNPIKIIEARKKPVKRGFQAIASYGTSTQDQSETLILNTKSENEVNDNLYYGIWQTDPWSPDYVGPDDTIPVNEFKNVELKLMNPGLVHIELRQIARVAKKLNIPYAPCLIGFEGYGGNSTPTIRGIVVHEHNAELLREAHVEWESQAVEEEYRERERIIYGKWKRLIKGIMEKRRLEKEYAKA